MHKPARRQVRIDDDIGGAKCGAGLSDIEAVASEQRLKSVANAKWQASNRRDGIESGLFYMGPQRTGQYAPLKSGCRQRRPTPGHATVAREGTSNASQSSKVQGKGREDNVLAP